MNPSTPITPPNTRTTRNNAESSTQQPSTPQVTRIVTQEERFSPTSLFRGPSEDEQSFGVIDELSSSSDEDMGEDEDQYAGDDILTTQTPARLPINVASVPTPKIGSPVIKKREIDERIQHQNKRARKKGSQLKAVQTSSKKKKMIPAKSPADNIWTFLRDPVVQSMKDKTKGSFLHTANSAMSDWHHSTPVGMGIYNFLKKHPFRAIMSIDKIVDKATGAITQAIEYHKSKTVLMSSFVDPITRDLHRMLLEDVVLMEPKDKCICYIAHDHVLLQTESMKRNVLECINPSRWKPKQLQKTW